VTVSWPWVRIPVLSNATVPTVPTDSRCVPPLISTPFFAALVMPETTLTGVLITSAHGQERTSSARPRRNHVARVAVEYSLTERGQSLQPVVDSLDEWGKTYLWPAESEEDAAC
jgi:hypothetical protein